MRRIALGLTLGLALAACGGGMSGTYADDMGIVSYEFKSNGKVVISSGLGAAVEMDYEKDGNTIRVTAMEGMPAQVLTLTDEGDLDLGLAVLKKQD